jgi:hypothetical protein
MPQRSKESHILYLLIVGLSGWLVPGAGHLMLNEKKHAIIIFVTIALTFVTGLYIGSIGVINPVGAKPWYIAQVMNSPAVAYNRLGRLCRLRQAERNRADLHEHRRAAQSFVYRKRRLLGASAKNRSHGRIKCRRQQLFYWPALPYRYISGQLRSPCCGCCRWSRPFQSSTKPRSCRR